MSDNDKSDTIQKPKKRGRKPKGGKITKNNPVNSDISQLNYVPNVILHLKCNSSNLNNTTDENNISYFEFKDTSNTFANKYSILDNSNNNDQNILLDTIDSKTINSKLKLLSNNLRKNSLPDKRCCCFRCTFPFVNPPTYIPQYKLLDTYYVYGCFCSPECAAGFLFDQSNIDDSTKYERFHLLNYIYLNDDLNNSIKPSPNPYYTLDKYYGSLTIEQYRNLNKNDKLLLVIDKPITRSLPELHIDNVTMLDFDFKKQPSTNKLLFNNISKTQKLRENFNLY